MAYEATIKTNTETRVKFDCRENPGRRLHTELAAMLSVPQGQHKNAKTQFMVSKPTRGKMNTPHSLTVLEQSDPVLSFTCHKFRDSAPFQVVFTI